jgi:hypothetical protein
MEYVFPALILELVSCLFMTGVIVFVQVVHYPLFKRVGESPEYHLEHQRRTSCVVAVPMLTELAAALYRVFYIPEALSLLGLSLLLLIWLSTALLQAPCHRLLLLGFQEETVDQLVRSNTYRCVAWLLRSGLLLYMLLEQSC